MPAWSAELRSLDRLASAGDKGASEEGPYTSRVRASSLERIRPDHGVQGIGLGLRWEIAEALLERAPHEIDFLEITPENYLGRGGAARFTLDRARDLYPVVTHGLSMSLGGSDAFDPRAMSVLREFLTEVGTPWHSDHACMSSDGGRMLHDLLPLPLTLDTAVHLADRIKRAQDHLGVPLAIENVSVYLQPGFPAMSEPEFLREVCERADCLFLFDVNNAVVNALNFGLDVGEWLRFGPLDRVVQIHVAGHEWFDFDPREGELVSHGANRPQSELQPHVERLVIDTHGADAPAPVFELLRRTLAMIGSVPIVIERDQNIPTLDRLLGEVARVRAVVSSV